MTRETKMITAMILWGIFLATVAEAIVGSQQYLIQGMIAWCVGTVLMVSAIAKRG